MCSPVHVASTMGFTACLQLLQAYRADFTTRSIHGATSLHEAAANGHTGSHNYQIILGYSSLQFIDVALWNREMPLTLVKSCGQFLYIKCWIFLSADSLEFLLACGIPADEPAGSSGATALHYAVTGAHGQCVHTLLQYGANINAMASSEVSLHI